MKAFKLLVTLHLALLVMIACNPQPEADSLLTRAREVIENHPDSAMHLIDSIFYPERSLNRGQYMEFLVTQVQAKYKTHRPVAEDTLVFEARDYFERKNNDPDQTALAYFYGGCVYREQQQHDEAMRHYKKTEQLASQTGNTDLRGLAEYNIGDLLAGQGYHRQALIHYSQAADIYARSFGELYKKRANCLAAMGRMYLLLEQPDSAFLHFQKGLDLAESSGDNNLQSLLAQNLSVFYSSVNQYERAEKFMRQSYRLNRDSTKLPRYYLNFARIYSGMNLPDSVFLYAELLKQEIEVIKDDYLKASVYSFLAIREKELGNYDAAFDYQDKYSSALENITRERLEQSAYEIQAKYDYEKMRNESERQLAFLMLWIIILLLGAIIGGALFSWYSIRQKNKLIHVQQQTEILKEIAIELNQSHKSEMVAKDQNIRELLLWKMNVVKKSALLSRYNKKDLTNTQLINEFYKIVYQDNKSDHWHNILVAFEQMNVGLTDKLRTRYPKLTETDFRIAILTYAGMTVRDISFIMDLSANTVQSYRNSLRKKLEITDPSIDTAVFLKRALD